MLVSFQVHNTSTCAGCWDESRVCMGGKGIKCSNNTVNMHDGYLFPTWNLTSATCTMHALLYTCEGLGRSHLWLHNTEA